MELRRLTYFDLYKEPQDITSNPRTIIHTPSNEHDVIIKGKNEKCRMLIQNEDYENFPEDSGIPVIVKYNSYEYKDVVINEVFAYEIAKLLNLPCPTIHICVDNGRLCSASESFLQSGDKFRQFYELATPSFQPKNQISNLPLHFNNVIRTFEQFKSNKAKMKHDYLNNQVFYALIGIVDAYSNNIGFIESFDKHTKKFSHKLAPTFDHDRCFINGLMIIDDRHFKYENVIQFILNSYYNETLDLFNNIQQNITLDNLNKIADKYKNLSEYSDTFGMDNMKRKIELVLLRRDYIMDRFKERNSHNKFMEISDELEKRLCEIKRKID